VDFAEKYWRVALIAVAMYSGSVLAEDTSASDLADVQAQLEAARMEVAEAAQKLARLQRELGVDEGEREVRIWRSRDDAEVEIEHIVDEEFSFFGMPPRLGVILGEPDNGNGNLVIGITPGSGAEAAGIRQDDRLITVAGRDVQENTIQTVREILADREAGETIEVMVQRGDETELTLGVEVGSPVRDMTIIARRLGDMGTEFGREMSIIGQRLSEMGGDIEIEVFQGLEGLEGLSEIPFPPLPPRLAGLGSATDLASNHEGLVGYFGTGEGVLVLRIAEDNPLNLSSGDVILSLDGQAVNRPVEIGRELMAREPGQDIVLQVMRAGDQIELSGKIPEPTVLGSAIRSGIQAVRDIPAPSTPPVPPAPDSTSL
jgi:predicted metalloprotease with PDZ domain